MFLEPLITIKDLKNTFLGQLQKTRRCQMYTFYDKETNTFIIQFVPPETETVVHYLDEHVAPLYRYKDKEIIGLQVEKSWNI